MDHSRQFYLPLIMITDAKNFMRKYKTNQMLHYETNVNKCILLKIQNAFKFFQQISNSRYSPAFSTGAR